MTMAPPRRTGSSDTVNGNYPIRGKKSDDDDDDDEELPDDRDDVDDDDDVVNEKAKMLPPSTWKVGPSSASNVANGRLSPVGRSSKTRSNAVYVSLPADDGVTIDLKTGPHHHHPHRRAECPLTVCDHFRDVLSQYYKQLILIVVVGVTGAFFLVFSRQYVFKAIDVLRSVDVALQCALFLVFFVICSFPLMWGYIVLVISAGFLHGAVKGSALVIVCAGAGVSISHLVLSSCLRDVVKRRILPSRNGLKALINAVDGVNGMRVVCLARFTPIPFGIQNAVFAISVLPRWKYVAASMVGLLPGQIIEAYIGSSLKNLGELYSHSHASPLNVTIIAIQIGITLCLFYYLFYLAKKELNKITTHDRGGGGEGGGGAEDTVTLIPDADELRQAEIRFHLLENDQNNKKKSKSPILASDHVLDMDSI